MRVGARRDKVQIVMSTFNGEKYLAEQLNSLMEQTHSHRCITIRDDGSSDSTSTIINEFVFKYPSEFKVFYKKNIGVIASFFELLTNYVHDDTDYVCFCDQDDVWKPHKLERGIRYLNQFSGDEPVMYFTPTLMVNETLQPINSWPPSPHRRTSFFNALVENVAVGATIMINRPAIDLIKVKPPHPKNIVMHDWWVYLVVSAFGKVVYDKEESIYYRQHQNNVVGGQSGIVDMWVQKWRNYQKHCESKIYWNQAKEFERCWGEHLPAKLRAELHEFLLPDRGFLKRTKYALSTSLYRQSTLDNLLLRLMMIRGDIIK
ncbi:glycosyltransferase family 2 protein [Paenibacillus sp. MER TA 81-3]|uniref:glycosyltransferase family 2 protein n=1 Tax=Paenibacillus sp. MER TA 81-3 TaxID=2939573 RepID=UPI00203B1991|nr:glycosyltransferase family 2 protein [Paenibacillus sp. MER TA 81-3]MCM3338830.1 glycosyltransferase family 2 protein [Paenibacillus sp. MER TA 81-3]